MYIKLPLIAKIPEWHDEMAVIEDSSGKVLFHSDIWTDKNKSLELAKEFTRLYNEEYFHKSRVRSEPR